MNVEIKGIWGNRGSGRPRLDLHHGITAEVFRDRGKFALRIIGRTEQRRFDTEDQAVIAGDHIMRVILSEAIERMGGPLQGVHL